MERQRQQPQTPETRQRNLVEAYGETMSSIVDGHEKMMRDTTEAYTGNIEAWNEGGHGRRKFDRLLAGTAQDVEAAAGSTGAAVEQAVEKMHDRVVKALSPADRKVLMKAQSIAEEDGVDDYKVSQALEAASSYAARDAMQAALDRDRLRQAHELAGKEGVDSYRVGQILGSGSNHGIAGITAHWALDAAMDGERLSQARAYAQEHGIDHYQIGRILEIRRHDNSWYAASGAMDAALDGERLDQARVLAQEHGSDDYRVRQALHSGSGHNEHWYKAQEALDTAIDLPEEFSLTEAAAKLGRQAVKAMADKRPRFRKDRHDGRQEAGFDGQGPFASQEEFEDFFRRNFGDPFEGFRQGGQWQRRHGSGQHAHGHSRQQGSGGEHSEGRTHEAPPPRQEPKEPNPYEILGVPRDADEKAIKKAYRDLARQHHPDLNDGQQPDEETMKKINNAYDILSKPEARAHYDQFGTTRGL